MDKHFTAFPSFKRNREKTNETTAVTRGLKSPTRRINRPKPHVDTAELTELMEHYITVAGGEGDDGYIIGRFLSV